MVCVRFVRYIRMICLNKFPSISDQNMCIFRTNKKENFQTTKNVNLQLFLLPLQRKSFLPRFFHIRHVK